ncbi:alpha/beta-hydrolase [Lophiostoma macrostomum CBS 122681]|uniref:Carboxylic ester hydrolase n=1 Tax=Lophiostoma macrostomum CBS 122681 TaxID=1314788 RepID=A0A6A6T449_9PLEO|nr:alpha/beta-hydrolase [Lophiostoma macrostomum CBS 122681]
MILWASLLPVLLQIRIALAVSKLTIETTSGPVTGIINSTTPHVAQFLGVPFAEQPVGARRWLPAILKTREESIDATKFGSQCPQFDGNGSNIIYDYARGFLNPPEPMGEDCLSVNIWAPLTKNATYNETESLPVIVWLYGGGFYNGGANAPYQIPSPWVERSQKHIVVAINYRVNIFGFPSARGLKLTEQNLGLLDQRLGLEWVRSNIANFGGDPERITLWGQSAGAMSVDFYNLAYPEDPIVSGLIMESGTALLPFGEGNEQHSNFTFVAENLGCGNLSAQGELACMRNISWTDIISFIKTYSDAATTPPLIFLYVVDNSTFFSNYTARALAGNFTKKPAITGTNKQEGQAFVLPYDPVTGVNLTEADATTYGFFACPDLQTSKDRYAAGAKTYRYQYAGNFSNISPLPWTGAYHSSEEPMVFGTYGIERGGGTEFEAEVSRAMQDRWLAFAEDPVEGLERVGWDAYKPGGNDALFGSGALAVQPVAESILDDRCKHID